MSTHVPSILADITGGVLDKELTSLEQAIRFRKETLQSQMRNSLRVGQTVWFNDKVRPRYMVGKKATVVKVNRERILVKLDGNGIGRFTGDRNGEISATLGIITTTVPH